MNLKSFCIFSLTFVACSYQPKETNQIVEFSDSLVIEELPKTTPSLSDTSFVNLSRYTNDFAYDMKYATQDNFLKQAVYTCGDCLVRKEVADALIEANRSLSELGLKIKFYDCYRPLDVQKLMWEIYPVAGYVANPYKSGSIHNRGGAVDITLVDIHGNELDMGTLFDFFGEKAHHSFIGLSDTILTNRNLLKSTMEAYRFKSIRTEWWHYNFEKAREYGLSNFKEESDN